MALANVTTTFDLHDLLGVAFDVRRTKVTLTTNAPKNAIHDTSTGETRIGGGSVTLSADGVATATTWAPGADANPATWQTTFQVDYADSATRQRVQVSFGPYTITTSGNLTALEEEQVAIPTATASGYADAAEVSAEEAADSATTAAGSATASAASADEAEAAAADAVDISNISTSDGVVEALVKNTGGAGPLTSAALSATYVPSRVIAGAGIDRTGVSDSTAAIQAILTASTSGQSVHLPAGTFLTGALTVPAGVRLYGPGTLKAKVGTTSAVVWAVGEGCAVDGITVDCQGSLQAGTAFSGIRTGGTNASVANCVVKNAYGYAIICNDISAGQVVVGNRIVGQFDPAKRSAISFLGGAKNGSLIAHNRISGFEGQGIQVNATGTTIVRILGNEVLGAAASIPIEIQNADIAIVSDNVCIGGSNGISIGACNHQTVSGNVVANQTNEGFELGTGDYQAVTGNLIYNCGIGMVCAGSATDININGNTILGCTTVAGGAAVKVDQAGNSRISVTNNVITDSAGTAVLVANGGTNTLVSGNNITQNTGGFTAIRVANGTHAAVLGNRCTVYVDGVVNAGVIQVDGTSANVVVKGNTVTNRFASTSAGNAYYTSASGGGIIVDSNVTVGDFRTGVSNEAGQTTDILVNNTVVGTSSGGADILPKAGTNLKNGRCKTVEGTAVPTTGTWKSGDRVTNTTVTSGGPTGWVCTTGGTPGTWAQSGTANAPSAGTTSFTNIAHAINTTDKYTGKVVFNATTNKPVWATGASAGSIWTDATGATAHTPA